MGDQQTHVDTGSYGTAAYAAPELLADGRLTRAADVYSWAVLAWSLLAGQTPFQGMQAMQVRKQGCADWSVRGSRVGGEAGCVQHSTRLAVLQRAPVRARWTYLQACCCGPGAWRRMWTR